MIYQSYKVSYKDFYYATNYVLIEVDNTYFDNILLLNVRKMI